MHRITELLDAARRQTGLDDFGDDDFREGLDRLVAALDSEAQLNDVGRASLDAQIVGLLAQRLELEDWFKRYPEIDEEEIVRPLVGVGLPRTGSTALAGLLGEDPNTRSLRTWEMMSPCPPPEAATMATDPRIAAAQAMMEAHAKVMPRMQAMVPSTATSATECQTFMAYSFKGPMFQSWANIPSYIEWLMHEADMVPTYRYVKRILKLLQWRCPTARWRIKNPSHLMFIDDFNTVFPDARFVMTHRDPVAVLGSVSDLHYEMAKSYTDVVKKHEIGRLNLEFWELGMRRMIVFRDRGADDRFFDIHFAPFQADPLTVIAGLYDWLGEEFSPQARANMAAWRRNTPRNTDYVRTDMAEFGLDPDALRKTFAFYCERFPPPA